MNLVTESKWEDVLKDGIGGDSQEQRVPSAYLLVYINNEQKSLSNGWFEKCMMMVKNLLRQCFRHSL